MKDFFNSIGNWFVENWKTIVSFFAIVILGILVVKIVLAIVKRQLKRTKIERTIQTFILSIAKFVLYLILIVCALSSVEVSITGLTVVISAISLAITLALQDSLKNLVNGFIIISTKLVKEGDWVKIGDMEGTVKDVRMLYIVLQTADNKKITIPNSTVIGKEIVNYNVYKTRRVDLTFDIAYDSNVDLAKEIVLNVVDCCQNVFLEPKPSVVLSSLNESSITLTLKVWCNSSDYWDTKWFLLDNIFNEFKRNNITIPFNQLEVCLVDNKKDTYIRKQKLEKSSTHKIKIKEDEDIIEVFNKKLKKVVTKKNKVKKDKKDGK